MRMNWRVERSVEGRGFVSKRIFRDILDLQMIFFGNMFYEDYGTIRRLLTPDEIFDYNQL